MSEHVGRGPDGSSLLGFLCAVGAFLTLDRAMPERRVRMAWRWEAVWRPVWRVDGESTDDELVEAIDRALKLRKAEGQELVLGDGKEATIEQFRKCAEDARQAVARGSRDAADHLQAMGGEVPGREGRIDPTALMALTGAGHAHFRDTMKKLRNSVTTHHLRQCLFDAWRYEDRQLTMRWDPADDRRSAFLARNPADEKAPSVWGANLLASEALALFPTAPSKKATATASVCVERSEGRRVYDVYWPLWTQLIDLATLRSLLVHPAVTAARDPVTDANGGVDPHEPRRVLRALGVAEVFRSRRIQTGTGQYRNFTPSEACLGVNPAWMKAPRNAP